MARRPSYAASAPMRRHWEETFYMPPPSNSPDVRLVSHDYIRAMGIRVLAGRAFEASDDFAVIDVKRDTGDGGLAIAHGDESVHFQKRHSPAPVKNAAPFWPGIRFPASHIHRIR